MRSLKYVVVLYIATTLTLLNSSTVNAEEKIQSPEIKVRYIGPGSASGVDKRNDYFIELLQHALARSKKNYSLSMGSRGLSGLRQLYAVSDGTVDVGWSLTTDEAEQNLLPIRIPIDKGLIGWRLLLINKDDEKVFADVKTIDDLRAMVLGQGLDWPDTPILRANHFTVQGVTNYSGIFKMLKQKRFRAFPRSILEIWGEQEEQKELDFAIENTLLIQYPAAFYYFVNRDNPVLAKDIELGLEAMIRDGEFDKIFNTNYAKYIKKAQLETRRVFKLDNPYLPKATPLNRPELWLDVKKLQKR